MGNLRDIQFTETTLEEIIGGEEGDPDTDPMILLIQEQSVEVCVSPIFSKLWE